MSIKWTPLILSVFFSMMIGFHAQAEEKPKNVISARSPEVLASYKATTKFMQSIQKLPEKEKNFCLQLLKVQLRMHKETDSWKMYSLYEVFQKQNFLKQEIARVGTITEFRDSIPQYTNYRKISFEKNQVMNLPNLAILVADKGQSCGPDPLSVIKGAYFVKCNEYFIGSGLIKISDLNLNQCKKVDALAF